VPKDIPKEIYRHFSFPEGGLSNYEEILAHFIPKGLFINNKGESPVVKSLDEFASFIRSNVDSGNILSIDESEIDNQVTQFGKVGQIASRYKLEAKTPNGIQTRYGINLFQILKLGGTWKVSSMCWDDYTDQKLFEIDVDKFNS